MTELQPRRQRSLAARTARTIILWCCLATIGTTVIGYVVVSAKTEQQVLASLSDYIGQRGRAESMIFRQARSNLQIFSDRFVEVYRDPRALRDKAFEDYFFADPDGAIRLRENYFSGARDESGVPQSGVSGFMGRKRPPLTPELQRRLIIGVELLGQFGPGWADQFANVHVSYPENALLMYWPQEAWGLEADPELDMTAGAVIKATLQSQNPRREPVWSGLYYDLTAQKWAVTYQHPVDWNGRHLANPSHDVFLDGLIRRLGESHPPGARNLILARNGDLIAQTDKMDEILQSKGEIHVEMFGDPELVAIYRALSAVGDGAALRTLKSDELDAYIAFTTIEGPGWWYVTVYPRSLVAAQARETTQVLLFVGLLLSAIITGIVLLVIRLRVSRPLRQMKAAAEAVGRGDYHAVVDGDLALPGDGDEVGVLARSFRQMAEKVEGQSQHLEQTVAERTRQLEGARSQLIHMSRVSAMGTMGATLAHELNQPLTAITNYASGLRKLIGKGADASKLDTTAEAIGHNAMRAGEIIRSLRRMTNEEGLRKQVSSVARLVREASALALFDAPEGGRIVHDVPEDIEIVVDPIQIQQVLLNLIRNAFEAMEGVADRVVTIAVHSDEEGVVICVEDEGPGIAAEAYPQVFESFFSTKPAGTGIGLSISRTIVEAHGGTIWAGNRENGGAAFCFRITEDDS